MFISFDVGTVAQIKTVCLMGNSENQNADIGFSANFSGDLGGTSA